VRGCLCSLLLVFGFIFFFAGGLVMVIFGQENMPTLNNSNSGGGWRYTGKYMMIRVCFPHLINLLFFVSDHM